MTTARTARIKPEDVKQPEDHKKEIKDVTVEFQGTEFTVKGKALKDYRLLMLLNKVEQNGAYLPEVISRMIGQEQHDKMVELLSDEEDDGYVDTETVGEFLQTLLKEANRKNS